MKNKKTAILVGVVIFLGVILVYSLKSPGGTSGVKPVGASAAADLLYSDREEFGESDEIVKVLSLLNGVNLKTDFFEDAVFWGLEDFSVQLIEGEMGRDNPFAAY